MGDLLYTNVELWEVYENMNGNIGELLSSIKSNQIKDPELRKIWMELEYKIKNFEDKLFLSVYGNSIKPPKKEKDAIHQVSD